MDYILAVQGALEIVSAEKFLADASFAKHLLELRQSLPAVFNRLVVVAPSRRSDDASRASLTSVNASDGVVFQAQTASFWRNPLRAVKLAREMVARPCVVHADLATDIKRPFTAFLIRAARASGRRTIFVTDIDFRQNAARSRRLGWSSVIGFVLASAQSAFKSFQIRSAVKHDTLVLLKSTELVRDFGKGQPNVRAFYDTVHSSSDVVATALRLSDLRERKEGFKVCYFGRLVPYKGVDRIIEAVALARKTNPSVELIIIGEGPERAALEQLGKKRGFDASIFLGPRTYGPELFSEIDSCDVMINSPLLEDTPRAAFDAMARGLPIVASDISYFRGFATESGAVVTCRWNDPNDMARILIELAADRPRLSTLAENAIAFASRNTQALWLKRRMDWLSQLSV